MYFCAKFPIFSMSIKAITFSAIPQAVNFDEPIGPDHPFFEDFSMVRGEFEEQIVYENLNVIIDGENLTFDASLNSSNKVTFFLGGMRGSGKTSELQKYAKKLHHPDCFYCIVCNIDLELDLNNLQYMDIMVFQLEKLTQRMKDDDIEVDDSAMESLNKWFTETVQEVNRSMTSDLSIEIGGEVKAGFWSILEIFGSLKAGMKGSHERATNVRETLKNRFDDFALHFNRYVEEANSAIRKRKLGQEILFIIDGLEKTMSADTRRKIILEETNRIKKVETYTLFTLPIELMEERQLLEQYFFVGSFPFVKLLNKDGSKRKESIEKFREFVFKRIDKSLFDDISTVDEAICLGGGSPRELLKILKTAKILADPKKKIIDKQALEKAIHRMANQMAQFITPDQWRVISDVVQNLKLKRSTPFTKDLQDLLERIIIMEYNDGNYKRPNPILERSEAFLQYVNQ